MIKQSKINDFQKFSDLYNNGTSSKEIQRIFDCSENTVTRTAKKLGLQLRRQPTKIICPNCNKQFKADHKRIKCCSISCANEYKTKIKPINCKNCNVKFLPHSTKTKFCSVDCVNYFRKKQKNQNKRHCKICGKIIRSNKKTFCSSTCYHRNLTTIKPESIIKLYNDIKKSPEEIAKIFEIDSKDVSSIIARNRTSVIRRINAKSVLKTCQICGKEFKGKNLYCSMECSNKSYFEVSNEEFLEAYNKGLRYWELAELFLTNTAYIAKKIQELKMKGLLTKYIHSKNIDVDAILMLYNENFLTHKEVAARLGISATTVHNKLKQAKKEGKFVRSVAKVIDEDELAELYEKYKGNQSKLAAHFKCCKGTIGSYLRKIHKNGKLPDYGKFERKTDSEYKKTMFFYTKKNRKLIYQ